ncbi:hypothetical protein IMSAGC012_01651 [Lachnospiraceae bacterium]|nr:hypothetical protein IMSAGC012_01651 [Lachnospiraceae bacterium]
MIYNSTNIQEIFEGLVNKKKHVILFGAGRCASECIKKINEYIWYLCDSWKTPDYITGDVCEKDYLYAYAPIEEFIDCIIDNDEEKQGKDFLYHEQTFQIKPPDYLKEVDTDHYIIIITTEKYENEIRHQLSHMDYLENMPCYSYNRNMHYYDNYSRGLIVDRVIIPYMEKMKTFLYWKFPENEYEVIKRLIEQGEYVCNGAAFQITTICNLRCKYCADYVPKMKKNRNMDVTQILRDIDTFFSVTGRCLYVQLSTAEAVLCVNLGIILKKLLQMEQVRFIEIITNGLSYPKDEEVVKLLANPKVMLVMSDYNMQEKTDESRKFYKEKGIRVNYLAKQRWKIEGTKPYDSKMSHADLIDCYMSCKQAKFCPLEIAEGRLTACGRIQRFVELSDFESNHDYLDFADYSTKKELKEALIRLNLDPYMDGCAWCAVPRQKPSEFIEPAEQLPYGVKGWD